MVVLFVCMSRSLLDRSPRERLLIRYQLVTWSSLDSRGVTLLVDDGPQFRSDCPSRLLLDEVTDKWSVLVFAALEPRPMRFNSLVRRLDGISKKSLTAVLRRLERNGLLLRQVKAASPITVEYEITPLGRSLPVPFAALYSWTQECLPYVDEARTSYDRAKDQ